MRKTFWFLPLTIALVATPGIILFVVILAFFAQSTSSMSKGFKVKDPNSPTEVWCSEIGAIGRGPRIWSLTISADGKRYTSYPGWPKEQIAPHPQPTALIWHSNPDWVEIVLESGERLKLMWDTDAAARARESRSVHYPLNSRFEVLPKQEAGGGKKAGG